MTYVTCTVSLVGGRGSVPGEPGRDAELRTVPHAIVGQLHTIDAPQLPDQPPVQPELVG